MLFGELPLAERPAAAVRAGFATVESWWPPADSADALAVEIGRLGLGVASLNAFGGDLSVGERGFLNVPGRYEQTLSELQAAIELARRLGGSTINVLAGRLLPETSRATQLDVVIGTLRDLAVEAGAAGITIVIEPLNERDVPGAMLPDPETAVEVIEAVGSDSMRLLYDAYHAAAAGRDPVAQAPALVDVIGHVQYADFPGRGLPGTGTVSLRAFAAALDRSGYRGAIGLELDPRGPTPSLAEMVGRPGAGGG